MKNRLKRPDELWTDYAKRRFEGVGINFEDWHDPNGTTTSDGGIIYLTKGSGKGAVIILTRQYKELANVLTSRPVLDQVRLVREGKLIESVELDLDGIEIDEYTATGEIGGFASFSITPNGRTMDEEVMINPKRLYPDLNGNSRRAQPIIERWVRYLESLKTPSKSGGPKIGVVESLDSHY